MKNSGPGDCSLWIKKTRIDRGGSMKRTIGNSSVEVDFMEDGMEISYEEV